MLGWPKHRGHDIVFYAAVLIAPYPALAQGHSQDDEIAAIKAEMKALEARLTKLELQRQASPASPSTDKEMAVTPAVGPRHNADAQLDDTALPVASRLGSVDAPPTPGAPAGKALAAYQPTVSLSAGSSGGSATISIGNFPQLRPTRQGDWYAATTERIEFSAPLDKSGGPTAISALDGLADGAKAKFVLSRYWRRVGNGDVSDDMLAELAALQEKCVQDALKGVGKLKAKECKEVSRRDFILDHYASATLRNRFRQSVFPGSFAFAAGTSFAVGYKNFKFVDPGKSEEANSEKLSFEAGAYVSLFPLASPSSATLSFAYQHAFKDAKAVVVCPVRPSEALPNALTCLSGPQGRPVSNNKALFALDYRRYLPPLPIVGRGAISPQVTYDAKGDDFAFDLPVYFVPNDKAGLIGGLRFGYGTKGDEFVAGLFVDAPFTIFH